MEHTNDIISWDIRQRQIEEEGEAMIKNAGIDYGLGTTNIDHETGIRYGVISMNDLSEFAHEAFEADYGEPSCPQCQGPVVDYDDESHSEYTDGEHCYDYACEHCKMIWDSENVYPEEALSYTLDDGEYAASLGTDDNDVFIVKSPYYTYAAFCSPCAPGAGHLRTTGDENSGLVKTYCFDATWFDNDEAPYPYYRVSDNSRVNP